MGRDVGIHGGAERHPRRAGSDQERLATTVAHDLESSLQMVSAELELLLSSGAELSLEQADRLEVVVRAVERMQRLVSGVTNYTRTGAGMELTRVPLEGVLNDARETLAPLIAERGATIVVTGQLPEIDGDRGQLIQLFQNLLSNALRYGPRHGGRVGISVRRGARAWRIGFSDQGPGIHSAHCELAFQPFRRLRGSGEEPGVGLGLTICREVAEHHGGSVVIEPRSGRGTTVLVTLPDRPPRQRSRAR